MVVKLDYEPSSQRRPRRLGLIIALVGAAGFFLLLASALLPRLQPPRREPNRCSSHLRTIGQAMYLYHEDYRCWPASLPDLQAEGLSPDYLICPSSGDTAAAGSPQQIATQLAQPGHCSYIYRQPPENAPPDFLVAYEPLQNHGGAGSNALFADGHVEYFDAVGLQQLLTTPATSPSTLPTPDH